MKRQKKTHENSTPFSTEEKPFLPESEKMFVNYDNNRIFCIYKWNTETKKLYKNSWFFHIRMKFVLTFGMIGYKQFHPFFTLFGVVNENEWHKKNVAIYCRYENEKEFFHSFIIAIWGCLFGFLFEISGNHFILYFIERPHIRSQWYDIME